MGSILGIAGVSVLAALAAAAVAALVSSRRQQKQLAQRLADMGVRLQAAETALTLIVPQARFLATEPAQWQQAIALLAARPDLGMAEIASQLGCSLKTLQASEPVKAAKRKALWGYNP